jgi:hypothetical protein
MECAEQTLADQCGSSSGGFGSSGKLRGSTGAAINARQLNEKFDEIFHRIGWIKLKRRINLALKLKTSTSSTLITMASYKVPSKPHPIFYMDDGSVVFEVGRYIHC